MKEEEKEKERQLGNMVFAEQDHAAATETDKLYPTWKQAVDYLFNNKRSHVNRFQRLKVHLDRRLILRNTGNDKWALTMCISFGLYEG